MPVEEPGFMWIPSVGQFVEYTNDDGRNLVGVIDSIGLATDSIVLATIRPTKTTTIHTNASRVVAFVVVMMTRMSMRLCVCL